MHTYVVDRWYRCIHREAGRQGSRQTGPQAGQLPSTQEGDCSGKACCQPPPANRMASQCALHPCHIYGVSISLIHPAVGLTRCIAPVALLQPAALAHVAHARRMRIVYIKVCSHAITAERSSACGTTGGRPAAACTTCAEEPVIACRSSARGGVNA